MKNYLFAFLCAGALTAVIAALCIPLLKKRKAEQTILKYVEEHKSKNGTPTMGGLFFVIAVIAVFFAFGGGKGRVGAVSAVFGAAYMITGFLDDFIKIKFRQNEGLKPYQKIVFQVFIGLIAGGFAYKTALRTPICHLRKSRSISAGLPCRSSRLSLLRSPTASI